MHVSIKHERMIGTFSALMLLWWVPGNNALESGPINDWLEQTFCTGQDDYVNLPWDCAGFIHCEIGHSHWMNCGFGQQFDSVSRTCVLSSSTCGNAEEAAATYCPSFKELKFAHPKSCAMYYDCSKTTPSPFGLQIYEEECPYPMLFDHKIMQCRNQDPQNPVPCRNTPTTRCDYVKECAVAARTDVCSGLEDGQYADPLGVFLPSYVVCTGGEQTGPFECNSGEIFDPLTRRCIFYYSDAMSNYCQQNPTAIFSDPLKCSMYFDCSKIQHHNNILKDYQTECKYLDLYDVGTRSCRRFDQMTIPCGFRDEPKAPCEYRVSDCTADGSCLPCTASCIGLPDGHNPYPVVPNTRFHLLCEGERTLEIKECPSPMIFLPGRRVCGNAGEDVTTTSPTVTGPPVTNPPVTNSPPTDPTPTVPTPTDPTQTVPTPTDPTPTVPTPTDPTQTVPTPTDPTPTVPTPTVPTPTGATPTEATPTDATATPTQPSPPECTMTPVCEAELALVVDNITMLTDGILALSSAVNEKLPDPYGCHTPPTIENGYLEISFSKTQAIATYTCNDGYTFCGESPKVFCETEDMWGLLEGYCAKSEFKSFEGETVMKCLDQQSTVIIRGRQIKEKFTILLRNQDGTGVTLLEYDGQGLKFGPEGSTVNTLLPHSLENAHEWRMVFDDGAFLMLDGEELGTRGYATRLNEDVILEFQGGYLPELVRFERNSEQPFLEIEPVDLNLAYRKPVEVSSTAEGTNKATITDGRNVVTPGSCWATTAVDSSPSVTVNLGQEYSISRVVVTLPNCTEASWCIDQLMAFVVVVGETLCGMQQNPLPESPVLEITCRSPIVGDSLLLEGVPVEAEAHLAFCEVEVYGGYIVGAIGGKWSPYDCPNPPLLEHATVRVEYRTDEAVAVYSCWSSHTACTENIIRCTGGRGWESAPRKCIPLMARDVDTMELCPLRVATALELWITPTIDDFSISIRNPEGRPVLLFEYILKVPSLFINDVIVPEELVLLKLGEESRLLVSVLTDELLVTVDGKEIFRKQGFKQEDGMYLAYTYEVTSQSGASITKALIHPSAHVDYEKLSLTLVDGKGVSASSSLNTEPGVVGFDVTATYAACWTSGVGDHDPWIQVDLGKQFAVESVAFVTEDCSDCSGSMQASGSTAAIGQPDLLLDGDSSGSSCFKSTESNPYWMVDTKGLYGILEVDIVGPADAPADFGDFDILLYAEDPIANTTAEFVTCASQTGPAGETTLTYTCSPPSDFRFLKIAKKESATTPLHLCEVTIKKFGNTILKDFKVTVYDMPESQPKICYEQTGKDTDPSSTRVFCGEPTIGQYVRLTKQSAQYLDVLQICFLSVSLSKITMKAWTPYSCPSPPLFDNSHVSVSWSEVGAVATYRCKDGFYNYHYQEVMQCKDDVGWDMEAKPCKPSLFKDSPGILYRPLRLGEALEVYLTPTENRVRISLGEELIDIQLEVDTGMIRFFESGTRVDQKFDLKLNQENQYVITLLTDGVELDVDGIFIGRVPYSRPIELVIVSPKTGLRSIQVVPVAETVAYKRALLNDLATADITSTLSDGVSNRFKAIGGEGTTAAENCWISAPIEDPFIMVELDNLYYIDRVEIDTRSDCNDEACRQRTHDIDIRVFHTSDPEEVPQFCAFRKDAITTPTATIKCEAHVTGRFVMVKGLNRKNQDDLFTICEIRFFGGEVTRNPKDNPFINLPVDPCPTMEGYISVESPRLCYKISEKPDMKSVAAAKQACGEGQQLLDVDTQEKHDYIMNVLTNMGAAAEDNSGNVRMHVGLTRVDTVWQWNSGSSFIVWEGGNPNDNQDCGEVVAGGINDIDCTLMRRYICEVPMTRALLAEVPVDRR